MIESTVEIKTDDGTLDVFICHPEEEGPHPVVVLYMDAPGIRPELRDMSSRLASAGYYVMLPNLYYRIGREGAYGYDLARIRSDDAHLQRMHACRLSLSNAGVVRDTRALLAQARRDPAADKGPIGCVGYCMSGSFVVAIGAAYPDEVAAIASFYGVGIITDAADSPHRDAHRIRAQTYLAFAQTDPWVPDQVLTALPDVIRESGWDARIEVYPETTHGFAFASRTDYQRAGGERHWERLHALFARKLPRRPTPVSG